MIREIIVTTHNADGGDHIAPMGMHVNGDDFVLAPFKPSQTLRNLLRERCAVINYTDDVRLFAACISKHDDLNKHNKWQLIPALKIHAKRLSNTLAHAEVKITQLQDDEFRPRLSCEIIHQETHAPFRGFNRAQAAILELAILVSRLHMLPWEKVEQEIAYLEIAISKTAGEEETTAWNWLMESVEEFKKTRKASHE